MLPGREHQPLSTELSVAPKRRIRQKLQISHEGKIGQLYDFFLMLVCPVVIISREPGPVKKLGGRYVLVEKLGPGTTEIARWADCAIGPCSQRDSTGVVCEQPGF